MSLPGETFGPGGGLAGATIAGVLLALCTCVLQFIEPRPGLDLSWQMALHRATHEHLQFGKELVFTNGPLGFLSYQSAWYDSTSLPAVWWTFLLQAALAAVVWTAARRSFGIPVSALLSLIVLGLVPDALVALAFLLGGLILLDRPEGRRRIVLFVVLGVLAGIAPLVKFNTGALVGLLVLTAALATPGKRRADLGAVVAGGVAGLLAGWLATGQSLGSLWDFFSTSITVASGYSSAMQLEEPGRAWELTAAAILAVAGVIAIRRTAREVRPAAAPGLLVMWGLLCFLEYKAGFVRHDGHSMFFFSTIVVVFVLLRWPARQLLAPALAFSLVLVCALAAAQRPITSLLQPWNVAPDNVTRLAETFDRGRQEQARRDARAAMAGFENIEPAALALVRGHTVHTGPYETAIAWTYGLDWRPLPVFQNYLGYSPRLDDINADFLASGKAPERILLDANGSIDGRLPAYDQPRTTLAMLCRYDVLHAGRNLVLGRRGTSRCGREEPVSTVRARWGESVPIPAGAPGTIVLARIRGVTPSGLGKLTTFLYKSRERQLVLDGTPHRLVEANAGQGLIVRADAAADWPAPFTNAPVASGMAVTQVGATPGGTVTYEFTRVRVGR